MARWRLRAKHYLNVLIDGEPVEWEYKETLQNGKQKRMTLPVPMYLDPEDASEHTPLGSGEIIVAYADKAHHRFDIIFSGPPTPDMEPVDDEAEEISASFADQWKHPIETLEGNYGESVANNLAEQLTRAIQAAGGIPSARANEIDELKQMLADQQKLINELLAGKDVKVERRV
jgi:hypothetical protein